MKTLLALLVFFCCSSFSLQQSSEKQFDFSIIFSGQFEKDTVSLQINGKNIFRSYLLDNLDSSKQGHLNLSQYESGLFVHYNGQQIIKDKIKTEHNLSLMIKINHEIKKCIVDLRKGRAIVVEYRGRMLNNKIKKEILIEQIAEPTILF